MLATPRGGAVKHRETGQIFGAKAVLAVPLHTILWLVLSQPNELTYGSENWYGIGIDMIDDLLDEFDGQGHRSKVKVTRLLNVIF